MKRVLSVIVAVLLGTSFTNAQAQTIITPENATALSQLRVMGHGTMTTSAWSDDGTMLAVGMSEEIRIYRGDVPDPLIIPGQNRVGTLAFRQDNHLLASSDSSGLVRLWNTDTGEAVGVWGHENVGVVTDFSFLPDADRLLINFYDLQELFTTTPLGTAIWEWDYSGSEYRLLAHTSSSRREGNMTLNSDHTLIATTTTWSQTGSGSSIATLLIRDAANGEIRQQLTDVRPSFSSLIFSPVDPGLVVSIDEIGVVRFWNVNTGIELFALTLPSGHITTAAFNVDGTALITGGTDGKVRIWDVSNGSLLEVFDEQPAPIVKLRAVDIEHVEAFSEVTEMAEVWNVDTKATVSRFLIDNLTPPLIDIKFDPLDEEIVALGQDATVRVWNMGSGDMTTLMQFNPDDWDGVDLSDEGRVAWMDAETGKLSILNPNEADSLLNFQLPSVNRIERLEYFSDTSRLFLHSAGDGRPRNLDDLAYFPENSLRSWDLASGSISNETTLLEEFFGDFAYSPELPVLVYTQNGQLWRRNLFDDEAVVLSNEDDWYSARVRFSPDGTLLAAIHSRMIYLWDTETWALLQQISISGSGYDSFVEFSPDSSLIVFNHILSANRMVFSVFAVGSGERLATLAGHTDTITDVVFDRSGSLIATASLDGTIRLWGIP